MRATSSEEDPQQSRLAGTGYGRFLDPQAGPVADLVPAAPRPQAAAAPETRGAGRRTNRRFDYSAQAAGSLGTLTPDRTERPKRLTTAASAASHAAGSAAARPTPSRGTLRNRLRLALLLAALALLLVLLPGTVRRVASWPVFTLTPHELLLVTGRGTVATDVVRVYPAGSVRYAMNALAGPPRVGLQVGHLDAGAQPDELASLRYSTGAHHGGYDEVVMNEAIVVALAERLTAAGIVVDVLPATMPPGYSADLVLSVHVDSNAEVTRGGYKSAHFVPARNAREPLLKVSIDRALLAVPGFADDDRNVSGNMLEYYAFNDAAFEHTVAGRTPALIVELGYLSNPSDLRLLLAREPLVSALEEGVVGYLTEVGRLR